MADLELTSQGVRAGYKEDGLFVFGKTLLFRLDIGDDREKIVPGLTGTLLHWSLLLTDAAVGEPAVPEASSPAERDRPSSALKAGSAAPVARAVGRFHRDLDAGMFVLSYHLPKDPGLAAFLMATATSGRALTLYGMGWVTDLDASSDQPAVTGFVEGRDTLFARRIPTLGMAEV